MNCDLGEATERLENAVAYLEFGSGGVWPLPLVLRGQFLLNYNNFVHSENTISEHMVIFKKNICKFLKYL